MIRRGALLACLLLHAACGPPPGEDGCGPMQRTLAARGDIRDGADVLATASVVVLEQRGDPSVLDVRVTGARGSSGAPLRGRVRIATLVRGTGGDTIRSFRIGPAAAPGGDEVFEASAAAGGERDAIKRMLRRRDGLLLLETDLAGRERIRVPLTEIQVSRWKRASCG